MTRWGRWNRQRMSSAPAWYMGMRGMDLEMWWNRRYVVLRRRLDPPDVLFAGHRPLKWWHLQIWRQDGQPIHRWEDLQRIKSELVGKRAEALELYPRESRVVNQAHVYHLWVWQGKRIPIGPIQRMVKGER